MKKRILSLLLVTLLAFSLCACGEPAERPPVDNPPVEKPIVYAPGVVENNVYTSAFLGLGIDLTGWTVQPTEPSEDAAVSVQDLSAENPSKIQVLMIAVEDRALLDSAATTAEEYLSLFAAEEAKKELTDNGFTDITVTPDTKTIAGRTLPAVEIASTLQGISIYQSIAIEEVGNYWIVYTAGATLSEEIDAIYAQFYAQ